jgi:hypothetical protein
VQGGDLEPKRCAFRGNVARLVAARVCGIAVGCAVLGCAVLGCDTVAMDFGEVTASAVANVYFQQLTPVQATPTPSTVSAATAARASPTHGSYCTVIQTEAPNPEIGTIQTHGHALVRTVGDSLVLSIEGADGVMAEHSFEQAFFDSRQVNTFTVTFANGSAYAYTVWGADSCETCPPGTPGGTDTCFPMAETPVPATPPVSQDPPPAVVFD